jgi:hypothetical protein
MGILKQRKADQADHPRPAADRAQARRNSSCPALCRRFVFSPPRAANTWRLKVAQMILRPRPRKDAYRSSPQAPSCRARVRRHQAGLAGVRIGVSPYQRAIEVGRRGAGRPAVAHLSGSMCLPRAATLASAVAGGGHGTKAEPESFGSAFLLFR